LDEIAHLIQRNGLTIFSNPYKAFPLVGQQVSERDAGVRNAALNVLVQTYAIAGDMTYKYVGRLSDKDKSLLDEKIRRSNVNEENRAVPVVKEIKEVATSATVTNQPRSRGIKKEFSLDFDQIEGSEVATVEVSEPIVRPLVPVRHETDDLAITLILTQLIDWNTQQSLEALRELEKIVIEFPERLRDHMNELIGTLSVQIKVAFTAENTSNANMNRWAKLLMPTMIHILSVPALCKAIDKDVLYRFMEEILQKLLDPSLQSLDESSQLPRHFNTLMVKILDNGNRNIVFW
jgi:cytoskeleton-associated protein 5